VTTPATPQTATVAPAPAGSSDNGLQLYGELPGGGFDPVNWPQDVTGKATAPIESAVTGAASAAASGIWGSVEPFLATALFVIFGLGLMGLGAFMIAKPSVKAATANVSQAAAPIAQAATDAAVVAA
jgi:hypothetical protein